MRTTGRALGRLLPLIALAAGPVVLGGASVAGAAPTDVPFTTVGSTTWTVPNGVSCVTVDAIGARGGDGDLSTDSASAANGVNGSSVHAASTGGNGGEAVSTIEVLAGQVLQVNVGGRGQDADFASSGPVPGSAGGFNGGGAGGGALDPSPTNGEWSPGAGGGGASDVRQAGTDLANRVVVGAGGGGGGGFTDGSGGVGGGDATTGNPTSGHGSDGDAGATGGGVGTSSAGGAGGASGGGGTENGADGALGAGGHGAEGTDLNGGGGGDTLTAGVDAGNDGNGKVTLSYTVGDTSCLDAPLTISKVTTGATPPAGTTFTEHLSCTEGNIDTAPLGPGASDTDVDFTFTVDSSGAVQPATGYTIGFVDPDTCTVTETAAGGAIATTYSCTGQAGVSEGAAVFRVQQTVQPLCSAAGPQTAPITVGINTAGQSVTLTVTNEIAAPAAVLIQPMFTG